MSTPSEDAEDPRRAFLLRALAAGLLVTTGFAQAQILGRRPQPLPVGRSVYEVTGAVTVNNQPATAETRIGAGDRVEVGAGGQLIFVVGSDAFLMRENSRVDLAGNGFVINSLRVLTGALLSVFGSGTKRVMTSTAAVGIRGTGLYVESEPDRSYVCTCYGDVLISAADDTNISERIVSKHHDNPRYVLKPGAAKRIQPAPFINHTDVELALIETLVGRTPPFSLFDQDYGGVRRY
ncbi:MAG: hypothetical protein OEV67_12130 [Betaproteobacteria bacterium]|nr:hypothetical protein [Betaproteobacteria bacterium]